MPIPESDHQLVANLIAFCSFLVTVIVVIWSITESYKTKRIARDANNIARQANETANKGYALALHDHKTKILPEIIGYFIVMVMDENNEDTDTILFTLRNNTQSKVTIDSIDFFGSTLVANRQYLNLPIELLYHQEIELSLNLNSVYRFNLLKVVKHSIIDPSTTLQEAFELTLLRHVESIRLSIMFKNEIGNHYKSYMRYDSNAKYFTGFVKEEPIAKI